MPQGQPMQPFNPASMANLGAPLIAMVISEAVNLGGSMLINQFFHSDPKEENIRLYDELRKELAESKLPKGGQDFYFVKEQVPQEIEQPSSRSVEFHQRDVSERDLNAYIKAAIRSLELAKTTTKCNICKKEISETQEIVKKKTKFIVDAEKKAKVIKKMKFEGLIDRDKVWSDLTEDEKEAVRREALEDDGE